MRTICCQSIRFLRRPRGSFSSAPYQMDRSSRPKVVDVGIVFLQSGSLSRIEPKYRIGLQKWYEFQTAAIECLEVVVSHTKFDVNFQFIVHLSPYPTDAKNLDQAGKEFNQICLISDYLDMFIGWLGDSSDRRVNNRHLLLQDRPSRYPFQKRNSD